MMNLIARKYCRCNKIFSEILSRGNIAARNFDRSWNCKASSKFNTSTFSMILSFLPNCTPYCSRDKFQHINLEINSAIQKPQILV